MRRVINGLRYDTDTATTVAYLPCTYNRGDFGWHDTRLYITPNGRWFLAGRGNAQSRWATPIGNNATTGGEGIQPLTREEAKKLLEHIGETGALEDYFQDEIKDA